MAGTGVAVLSLTGAGIDRASLLLMALAAGVVGTMLLRSRPRLALLSYLLVLCLVPVWRGVHLKIYMEPQILWGLVLIAVLVTAGDRLSLRITAVDGLVAAFVLVSLTPLLTGGASLSTVFVVGVQWLGAFLVGRLMGRRVDLDWCLRAVAVVFTGVAVLAVAEYLTGVNPFLSIPGAADQYAVWGTIQERGGAFRAEGAFGHSIALGAALAMAVPLTLASSFRARVRVGMTLAMLAGVAVTFSRIGLVSAGLGIVLSVVVLREEMSTRTRLLLAGSVTAVGLVLLPVVTRVFAAAGNEATDSAAYRGDLLTLVGAMRPLGISEAFHRSPTGKVSFGRFHSIDSALILQGLTYGWLSLLLMLVLLAVAAYAVVTRRASAPTIAIVAQIPALATVALITQYSTMVWFVAGLAVYADAQRRPGRSPEPLLQTAAPTETAPLKG